MIFMLSHDFFARDPVEVAKSLLGKALRHYHAGLWLSAMIIEVEAYYLNEKGSHSSLGFTEKRKALFMDPGTIYMYYARGGDSLNVSCLGKGNAVLIKSGIPLMTGAPKDMIPIMHQLNPLKSGQERPLLKLCSGQTLLCRSLGLKVPHWNQRTFVPDKMRIDDVGYCPNRIIQTTRLGIPLGRDEHLPYRFVDYSYARYCTSNPLTRRGAVAGKDYVLIES